MAYEEIIKTLIIEDSPIDIALLSAILQNSQDNFFDITSAPTIAKAKLEIEKKHFDIILSDLNLEDSNGQETIKALKHASQETPLIVITGMHGKKQGIDAVSCGAQDYLVKGHFDSTLLIKSILYSIERKKIDKALLQSVEKHKRLIENLPIGIMNFTASGIITYCNPALFAMLNTPPQDIISKSIFDFIPETFEKTVLAKQLEIMQKSAGNTYEYSGKRLTRTKRELDVYVIITSIDEPDSKERSFSSIITDISRQKRSEKDKKLLEAQLLQSQKMESIGTLAAGVAHEINTPIQFIGDNTLFIKDSVCNLFILIDEYANIQSRIAQIYPIEEYIKKITSVKEEIDLDFLKDEIPTALTQSIEGITRVTNIVKAMKDFSHSGNESMALENINQAIESTIIISRNEWKYCARLETELSSNLPLIECYIGEIKQVILNLIINSIHAIQERIQLNEITGVIKIETKCTQNNTISIIITDNGAGIPQEIQSKVFDHFFTTKKVGVGTGQGLSLAYQTIKNKHHGEIELQSTVGEGTQFTLTLPIKQQDKV